MSRPSFLSARPMLFLFTLAITVACTSAPAVAQSAIAPTPGTPATSTPPSTPPVSTGPSLPGAGGNVGSKPGGVGGSLPGQGGGTEPGVIDPDEPITGGGGVVDPPVVPDDGWKTIGATPGLTNLRPNAWDHISVSADGKTVTVYFWSGVEACYGLSEVRLTRPGGIPTITVITGTRDLPADFACIDLAQGFKTTITLDEPLILDGSQTVQP